MWQKVNLDFVCYIFILNLLLKHAKRFQYYFKLGKKSSKKFLMNESMSL